MIGAFSITFGSNAIDQLEIGLCLMEESVINYLNRAKNAPRLTSLAPKFVDLASGVSGQPHTPVQLDPALLGQDTEALAFGVASGAGAIAGLYGAIILGFFAALFGGTPTQISGPTGPMTVVFATAVVAFPNDLPSVMTVVFLSGLMQISFGIVGIGKWIKYIPYPVISGFMCGIGVMC